MRDLLKQLVETESPSHDKAAVDRVGKIVADECSQARRAGRNRFQIKKLATTSSPASQPATLIRKANFDSWSHGYGLPAWDDSNLSVSGRGRTDSWSRDFGHEIGHCHRLERSPLANGGAGSRPVWALFTSDEEIGSHTSRGHIERSLARECEVVFVLEGALVDGSLKTWRKGVGEFYVKVKGRAAHAGGDHQAGRNAIEEMAHQIIAIQKLTDYERQTTLNVGVIHGGTASNVVPDEASIEVDVRVMQPGEWERIEGEMRKLKPALEGTSLEITGALNRPPMPYGEGNRFAFEKAAQIARDKLGMELKAGGSGGGSDGNFVAPLGIPVLDGMGAVGEGYHSEREYIFADSLEERAKLLEVLLSNW